MADIKDHVGVGDICGRTLCQIDAVRMSKRKKKILANLKSLIVWNQTVVKNNYKKGEMLLCNGMNIRATIVTKAQAFLRSRCSTMYKERHK